MATDTAHDTAADDATTYLPGGAPEAHHPSDGQYVVIAAILAGITAIEVLLYYVSAGALNTPLLLIFAAAKFAIVVLYFMHLKFDSKIVRRLFVVGLITAGAVYMIALATFHVFPWDSNRDKPPLERGLQQPAP